MYVLWLCFGKELLDIVKSVDDDFDEMWRCFDFKYGDFVKIVDVIIDGICWIRMIWEGEEKRFIDFVIMFEDGYCDLKWFGLEVEIIIISLVSIIERKFFVEIRREWVCVVSVDISIIDKMKKFLSLL